MRKLLFYFMDGILFVQVHKKGSLSTNVEVIVFIKFYNTAPLNDKKGYAMLSEVFL